jgi:myosin heavy subunit
MQEEKEKKPPPKPPPPAIPDERPPPQNLNFGGAGWCWVPHESLLCVPGLLSSSSSLTFTTIRGTLHRDEQDTSHFASEEEMGGALTTLEPVSAASWAGGPDNLTELEETGQGPIVHSLRQRYERNTIYTYLSTILLVTNPYQRFPELYSQSMIEAYHSDDRDLRPHIYAIAANAVKNVRDSGLPQAVVISGESGAGKTEATKSVVQVNFFDALCTTHTHTHIFSLSLFPPSTLAACQAAPPAASRLG